MRTKIQIAFLVIQFILGADCLAAAPKKKTPKATPEAEISSNPNEVLSKAEEAFQNGDFSTSSALCLHLETQNPSLDTTQSTRLLALRARLEFAARNSDKAKPFLARLLAINPKFELDPLSDPPEAISLLRELKASAAQPPAANNGGSPTPHVQSQEDPEDGSNLLRKRAGFWSGLLPFGIGHFETGNYRSGIMFLGTDTLSIYVSPFFRGSEKWSPAATKRNHDSVLPNRASELLFAGSWGYEILNVMPSLLARDNLRANWARHWLSFFPLGVGQMKNGHSGKAIGFGVAQSALLLYSLTTQNSEQRRTANGILVGILVYGAFDGWLHHKWINFEPKVWGNNVPSWQFAPSFTLSSSNSIVPTLLIEKQL